MTTTQNKIEMVKDSVKICSAIYHFGFDTIKTITEHTGLAGQRVKECLEKTKLSGFTWKDGSRCGLEPAGREYVEGLARNSGLDIVSRTTQFKDEALSGLIERKSSKSGFIISDESKLKSAVLPKGMKQHTAKTPEDFIIEQDREKKGRARIAKDIGITVAELEKKHEQGLIAICKGCGNVELFHKDGEYRQGQCIKCKKKKKLDK